MARRLNDAGDLLDPNADPYALDPEASRDQLLDGIATPPPDEIGGRQGITDPPVRAADPSTPLPAAPPSASPPAPSPAPTPAPIPYGNDGRGRSIDPPTAPPPVTGIGQSDNPGGKGYQGGNNPTGYTGYGAPPAGGPGPGENGSPQQPRTGGIDPLPPGMTQTVYDNGPTTSTTAPSAPTPPMPYGTDGRGRSIDPAPAPTSNPASPADSAFNQQMRDQLLSQLTGLSEPTSETSGDVAPALTAFNRQSDRDQQDNRDAIAERFYAQGGGSSLHSGGFDTAVQQGRETAAGQRANFAGSTVLHASQQKRQQLQQMLATATQAGLMDSAQKIQQQIASVDAEIRRHGQGQQNRQFEKSLGQQNTQFGRSLEQQNTISQRSFGLSYAELNQRQRQFVDSQAQSLAIAGGNLGFNYADLEARMNRDTLLAGLKG